MIVSVDGNIIELDNCEKKKIGEILGEIEASCEQKGSTITNIIIDGEEINAELLDSYFVLDTKQVNTIDLETSSSQSILTMANNIGKKFLELSKKLSQISVLLHTGNDKEAIKTINDFTHEVQNFFRLIPLLPIALQDDSTLMIDNKTVAEFITEMQPFLEELLEGLSSFDTVLLGDISEYELAPRLEILGEWLIKL